ncbi:anthranilate phosphoribosyltransferase [Carnobacterium maltaromaticum]|uniref:anthranilate phosphoribosyltransferase n=1 Tax=Carnobacterium maltaromaticum TaxID=2751 RepID=UPI00295EFB44|nr:anthranilate phosphoribosyltransferase [Carnobacterium maltaromaticum]
MIETLLQKIYRKENLSISETRLIGSYMLSGTASSIEITAFLTALKMKGETIDEMVGMVEAIKSLGASVQEESATAMDNCGTGGDASESFNISTTSAFVLAAAGIPIAKHGNRSISSRSGSSDVCQELGIELNLSIEEATQALKTVGITFIFAPYVHPNMRYVSSIRKELKTPTIFNLIGPLTNPVPLETQLVGIYRRDLIENVALTLQQLGRKRGIVVNGADFMDEASLSGINHYALLEDGIVSLHTVTPEEVGLKTYQLADIKGGDAKENAEILLSVLRGESSAYYDTVLLNSGLGLYANGKVSSIKAGVEMANKVIQSGLALQKLEEIKLFTQGVKQL